MSMGQLIGNGQLHLLLQFYQADDVNPLDFLQININNYLEWMDLHRALNSQKSQGPHLSTKQKLLRWCKVVPHQLQAVADIDEDPHSHSKYLNIWLLGGTEFSSQFCHHRDMGPQAITDKGLWRYPNFQQLWHSLWDNLSQLMSCKSKKYLKALFLSIKKVSKANFQLIKHLLVQPLMRK